MVIKENFPTASPWHCTIRPPQLRTPFSESHGEVMGKNLNPDGRSSSLDQVPDQIPDQVSRSRSSFTVSRQTVSTTERFRVSVTSCAMASGGFSSDATQETSYKHTIIIIASFTSTPASVTFVASQRRALRKGAARRNPPNLPRSSRSPFRFLAPSGAGRAGP